MLIACLRAYRTTRYLSLTLLAAWVPLELEILGRGILACQKYNWPIKTVPLNITSEMIKNTTKIELKSIIKNQMMTLWQGEWNRVPTTSWTKFLFPTVESAIEAPLYADFFLTQALTGHGVFGSYLHKIKKLPSPECPECGTTEDPEHVFTYCTRFEIGRPLGAVGVSADWLRYMKTTVEKLWEIEQAKQRGNTNIPSGTITIINDTDSDELVTQMDDG